MLASKTLSGEATAEERQALRNMLQESNRSALLYNEIKEYWNAEVAADENLSAVVDMKIRARIGQSAKRQSAKRKSARRNLLPFWRAAAILLLAVSCGIGYYYSTHTHNTYIYATQASVADYVLEDGSKVKLNKNSSITFTDGFGQKDRAVELTGEAYFDVAKNRDKRFTVRTQNTEIQVFGTQFNVLSDEADGRITVALTQGAVRFKAEGCDVMMKPEEEVVYDVASYRFSKQTIDLQFNTAWTKGRYLYSDITFGEFVRKLEHICNVGIEIEDRQIAECNITASFLIDQPVGEILSALKDELKFKYRQTEDNRIVITKLK